MSSLNATMNNMLWFDILWGFLYALGAGIIGWIYCVRALERDPFRKKFFLGGLFAKLISALAYSLLFQLYYTNSGDSAIYHGASIEFRNYMLEHKLSVLDFFLLNENTIQASHQDFLFRTMYYREYFINSSLMIHKWAFLFGNFSLFQYTATGILFALFAFWGSWKMANALTNYYPQYQRIIFVSFLLIPSFVFWSAGVSKEAICIGCLNFGAAAMLNLVRTRKKILYRLFLATICFSVVWTIKSYIVLSFVPIFLFFLIFQIIQFIPQKATRKNFRIGVIIGSIFIAVLVVLTAGNTISDKIKNDLISSAFYLVQGQKRATVADDSSYDIGLTVEDMKESNVKPYILPSINVALFRPFPWEVHKVMMVFSMVESFAFLLLVLWILIRSMIWRSLYLIFTDSLLVFSISYSLFFAFFVGLASANFGTLVRYKTPFISYFLLALLILNLQLKKKEKSKEMIASL